VAFQLRELSFMLERIAAELEGPSLSRGLDALLSELEATPLAGFDPESGADRKAACERLQQLLERAETCAFSLSDELGRRFFTHTATPAPVGIGEQ
jgi:hypothetical protein